MPKPARTNSPAAAGASLAKLKDPAFTVMDPDEHARSGSHWTQEYLDFFGITTRIEKDVDFFGCRQENLETPVSPEINSILNTHTAEEALNRHPPDYKTAVFLDYMEKIVAGSSLESRTDNFVQRLLILLGYEQLGYAVHINYAQDFKVAGIGKLAQADVVVRGNGEVVLLVVEDKPMNHKLPIGQLVAELIAAFVSNQNGRLDKLDCDEMAGLIFLGTNPHFFKMVVTQKLVDNVSHGMRVPAGTNILRQFTPYFQFGNITGMNPLAHRVATFRCLKAFREDPVFKRVKAELASQAV